MADTTPREKLLAAAVEQALKTGIGEMSLRDLASALGTSHRMLLYHFGSHEQLLQAVTHAVESRERTALIENLETESPAATSWARVSDPALWPQVRLFFELYARALFGRPGSAEFLDGIVDDWVEPVADALERAGIDRSDALAEARLGVAVTRGLLLDLVATGERDAVQAAFDKHLEGALSRLGL